MDKRIVKYNPAFLSEDELVESFVVRHGELDLITQALRENTGPSNQHLLVLGPRGIGKTMLVLRTVEEVRRDKELAQRWYPLVFSEESYQVTTPGEFWLEAIFHLGQRTEDAQWKAMHEELEKEHDETRLRERALAQLLDFADARRKRLLLVVENLNMLLGEQMDDEQGWTLRHTLLNEPRLMLLATATSRFEEIDNVGKPMFELFRTIELEPLDETDCRKMWTSISGAEVTDRRIRPVQILTGGSPRLVSIISSFGARLSFKELMDDLMQLVDDHTEYFKSHLDNLPAVERKVYLALVELWDPATAREVARKARLDVNKTSSLLRRLKERGAVVEADGQGPRKKLYQVAERLYNIYYLMRRHGAPSQRVRAVVNFMVAFYGETELVETIRRIAQEACGLSPRARLDHYVAYEEVLRRGPADALRSRIVRETPIEFLNAPDVPASLRDILATTPTEVVGPEIAEEGTLREDIQQRLNEAKALLRTSLDLLRKTDYSSSVRTCDELVRRFEHAEESEIRLQVALAWFNKGVALHEQKDYTGAVAAWDELLCRFGNAKESEIRLPVAWALFSKGMALHEQKDYAGALAAYDELVRRFGTAEENEIRLLVAQALSNKGRDLHQQKDYAGAVAAYEELVRRFGDAEESEIRLRVARALFNKGLDLHEQNDYAGAVAAWDELVCRFGDAEENEIRLLVAQALFNKGVTLHEHEDYAGAVPAYDELVRRFGDAEESEIRLQVARALFNKGLDLREQKDYAAAVAAWDELVRRFGDAEESEIRLPVAGALFNKGVTLHEQKDYGGAVAAWDELDRRFGNAEEGEIRLPVARALFNKGVTLHEQKDYAGAVAAYDELVRRFGDAEESEIRLPVAQALSNKGRDLHEQKDYAGAVAAYDELVCRFGEAEGSEIRLLVAEALFNKGVDLGKQKDYSAAATAYDELLQHFGEAEESDIELLVARGLAKKADALCEQGENAEAVVVWQKAEEAIAVHPHDCSLRNALVCVAYKHRLRRLLPQAEMLAKTAVSLEPANANLRHTLACVLYLSGKETEALEEAKKYLDEGETVEETVEDAIELFVGLAAAGYGKETLRILQDSPSAELLEPLVVGLRLYLGEDVKVAAEIMEVARDVVKRMEERREELTSARRA